MHPLTDQMSTVWVRHTVPAPTERVFTAWIDADLVPQWLVPDDLTATRAEISARVGGHYRIWYAGRGFDMGGIEAKFMAIEPDRRISLRWGFCGPERLAGPIYDSLLSVRFRPNSDGGTHLNIVHEHLGALRLNEPDRAEAVERNWIVALHQLDALL